ncbi:MAG: HdeD family acid-resistance protein [Chromatiales bacterium]
MYEKLLLNHLGQNWEWIALRGLVAVIFGVVAFIWPGVTLGVLTLLWGAYALADGILALVAAFRNRDRAVPVWTLILIGLAGIGAGIVTFLWPGMTAIVLLVFIAAWAVIIGVLQIVAAIRLRKEIEYEWFLGLSGVLSVVFGVLMILDPSAGALAVVWIIASYAIAFGIMLIVLGFRLKGLAAPIRR